MPSGVFVTGTDTGVGKTLACVGLLRGLAAAGANAIGMKPVSAGIASGASWNDDVEALDMASSVKAPLEERNPIAFAEAVAPHLAALREGRSIDLMLVRTAFGKLSARADVVVVEGAGGVLVPLGDRYDMLDVARLLALPVLLVVGVRLGCLSHARLSALAIRARGLRLAGWIASRLDPAMHLADENIAWLERELDAPKIAEIWGPQAHAIGIEQLALLGLASAPTRS